MSNSLELKGIKSVLFICMANICRSPSAEAVFRHKAKQANLSVNIDSAGTKASNGKDKPDRRSQKAGMARGYSFDKIKSRRVTEQDFEEFDLILAMDSDNVSQLEKVAPEHLQHKIHLFLEYANNNEETDVPDPYYGGGKGFELVLDLIEDASEGLIKALK
jgi:protein-tyrosine phosphatase